ncbi:hypothetical protein LCGC14_0062230 [marine sediment metagenome]|uniref:Uncharacterized protein n=1 Tax=marine sediment metagenome TaxID=412755 RepID=A0A0F9Y519_9ZZZZ
MAARGSHRTLFNFLFPITITLSFTLFYLAPLVVTQYTEPSALAEFIRIYLKWSVLVVVTATLLLYHKARQWMLAPFIKQIEEQAAEHCKEP